VQATTLFFLHKKAKKKRAKRKDKKRRFFAKPAPLALLAIRTPLKLDVADCMFIVSFFFFLPSLCRRRERLLERVEIFESRVSVLQVFFAGRFFLFFFRFFFSHSQEFEEKESVVAFSLDRQSADREHNARVRRKKKRFPYLVAGEEEKRGGVVSLCVCLCVLYLCTTARADRDKQRRRVFFLR